MADGKQRYKSDRKDHKISVKLSEKDVDILKAALKRTGLTVSAYIRGITAILINCRAVWMI